MRLPRLWFSVPPLLVMFGILAGTARPAEAGRGIIVKQTTLTPVHDPKAQLNFDLTLVGLNQMFTGDNITFLDIAGYSSAHYDFALSSFFTVVTTQGSSSGLTNVELEFTPPPLVILANMTTTDVPIGTFEIETTFEFDPPQLGPLLQPITYTTQTHLFPSGDLNLGRGVTQAFLVPEPASLGLLAFGLVGLAIQARRRRRSPSDSGADGKSVASP